jgi:RNA polymerase sigma-70 factor (ECF subfamily)
MVAAPESDQQLVTRAQGGSREAFNKLVSRHRSRLLKQLNPLLHNPREAEDVAQETFIKAYRALRHFRGDSAFSTWIYRIAVNTANHSLRKAGRSPVVYDLSVQSEAQARSLEIGPAGETPEGRLESKQLLDLLHAILESLPEDQRKIFVLREVEALSYEEIAIQMQCPIGTVRSRIHRVREIIASTLKTHVEIRRNPSVKKS